MPAPLVVSKVDCNVLAKSIQNEKCRFGFLSISHSFPITFRSKAETHLAR